MEAQEPQVIQEGAMQETERHPPISAVDQIRGGDCFLASPNNGSLLQDSGRCWNGDPSPPASIRNSHVSLLYFMKSPASYFVSFLVKG